MASCFIPFRACNLPTSVLPTAKALLRQGVPTLPASLLTLTERPWRFCHRSAAPVQRRVEAVYHPHQVDVGGENLLIVAGPGFSPGQLRTPGKDIHN